MLFCSANPSIWNQKVERGPNHFARPLTDVPNDIRFLRVRRGREYVVISMSIDRLTKVSAEGGFGWEGTGHESSGAFHLGGTTLVGAKR